MSEYSQFKVLCFLLVYSCLIQLWHYIYTYTHTHTHIYIYIYMYTVYLFFFEFFCHRDYCRSSSKVPVAEHQVLLDHLWQLQFSVYIWKEGKRGSFWIIYYSYRFLCICKSLPLNSSLPFLYFFLLEPSVWILSLFLSCNLVLLCLF